MATVRMLYLNKFLIASFEMSLTAVILLKEPQRVRSAPWSLDAVYLGKTVVKPTLNSGSRTTASMPDKRHGHGTSGSISLG